MDKSIYTNKKMKNILITALLLLSITATAQKAKFRTLNNFVADTADLFQFDEFDDVRVIIYTNDTVLTVEDTRAKTVTLYQITRVEKMIGYKIAYLSNGEQFFYQPTFARPYFISADGRRLRQYRRL
jgi:hypothetical protein